MSGAGWPADIKRSVSKVAILLYAANWPGGANCRRRIHRGLDGGPPRGGLAV